MTETVSSTLNPSANVFVPGKISNLQDAMNCDTETQETFIPFGSISKAINKKNLGSQIQGIAKQILKDYLTTKRNGGDAIITTREIKKLASRVYLKSIPKTIESRLSTFPELRKQRDLETDNEAIYYCSAKHFTFDLSVFKPPKLSPFLSSLYGLYRSEQSVRPLLSLTLPPRNLRDNLWSVTSKDLSLWNPYCDESCTCPPMFGYCVPSSFFGNPFNLDYKCSKERVHLCRYPPSPNGNESILYTTKPYYPVEVELLEDWIEEDIGRESNLEFYSEQLKTIVTGVCDLISNENPKESLTSLINYEIDDYKDMFWDADSSEFVRDDEIPEDVNSHPLLEMEYPEADEGVTSEIEEMIRRCLSPDPKTDVKVSEGSQPGCCDPPCSIWCSPKSERLVSTSSSVSANISLLNDTTEFLLNAGVPSNGGKDFHKRTFKRSFSANDCDLSFEERYKINPAPHYSTSSREDLEFLRRDPINFFKSLRKCDSWKDNDSGIVSHWSSQEDISADTREEGSYLEQDHAPMWSLFSGEDSLWKPLPECAQQDQHSKFMPKRVRDLRRQMSLN